MIEENVEKSVTCVTNSDGASLLDILRKRRETQKYGGKEHKSTPIHETENQIQPEASQVAHIDAKAEIDGCPQPNEIMGKEFNCESCPAGGEWDWKGPGLWCFHSAYFLGKSAKPVKCSNAINNCPLKNGNMAENQIIA